MSAIMWAEPANADTLSIAEQIAAGVAALRPDAEFALVPANTFVTLRVDVPDAEAPVFVWMQGNYGEVAVSRNPGNDSGGLVMFADEVDVAAEVVQFALSPSMW